MRKFPVVLFSVVVSLIAISCSNFALPERVHVKAGINPTIPVNSKNFNFSEKFQEELGNLFASGDDQSEIKVFNYTGDAETDDTQKFLLSFPMKEQSLDFESYLSEDLEMDSKLSAINRTFTLDNVAPSDGTRIYIDMNDAIKDIFNDIHLNPVLIPIVAGSNTPSAIPITATGFTSLSFYEGDLEITFSRPAGQNYAVTLSNLKINSISSRLSTYTLNAGTETVTASFPLASNTLTQPLSLSCSYFASSTSGANSLEAKIEFSNNRKLKTVKGVNFNTVSKPSGANADEITPSVPSEFVQALVKKGTITLDTNAIKGINLDLSSIKIGQADQTPEATYNGQSLKQGLDVSGPASGQVIDLAGENLNRNPIKTTGGYTVSVSNQVDTEATFNESGALEIPVSFTLESFNTVYINGQTIINDFNNGPDSKIEIPLNDLSQTVTSIKLQEAGAELTFGKSAITGLELKMSSDTFEQGWYSQYPIVEGVKKFTRDWGASPVPFAISPDSKIIYNIELVGNGSILELSGSDSGIAIGEKVTIIDCHPKVVFDWTEATINPDKTDTKGSFPAAGEKGFSFGDNDLGKILNNMEFDDITGYLFFSGPKLSDESRIALTMTAFPGASQQKLLNNEPITLLQTALNLPKNDESFTAKISDLPRSTTNPIPFTDTFNRMLPTENKSAEELSIEYEMDFGSGLTITKDMTSGDEGVKAFKADLVIIVPLKLKAGTGGVEIDVTEYIGDMKDKNLLSFMEDTGDTANISFNALALNIGMTGAPLKDGQLNITRDTAKDGESSQIPAIPLTGKNISINLSDYLGAGQRFTLKEITLGIKEGGYLQVPQGLSLLSLSVNAGVDAYIDL